jgi:hypothetical protein
MLLNNFELLPSQVDVRFCFHISRREHMCFIALRLLTYLSYGINFISSSDLASEDDIINKYRIRG